MADEGNLDTVQLLESHLSLASDLCERCQKYPHIKGSNKLLKKCQAELKFLKGLANRPRQELRESHLRSSNLASLQGIVVAMETLPGVSSILQPFPWSQSPHPIVVDLVCNQGYTWVKVVARKAQALHLVWAGGGQFGERNVVHQAEELAECASRHPHNFKTPEILFVLTSGVTASLKEALNKVGVQVQAKIIPVEDDVQKKLELNVDFSDSDGEDETDYEGGFSSSKEMIKPQSFAKTSVNRSSGSPDSCLAQSSQLLFQSSQGEILGGASSKAEEESPPLQDGMRSSLQVYENSDNSVRKLLTHAAAASAMSPKEETMVDQVNLDITSLIALVSAQCHGRAGFIFHEEVLTRQAAQERANPILPDLQAYMEGKKVIACETAVNDFRTILRTVGGAVEKERAERLLQTITIVPDNPSDRTAAMAESAKIKPRAKAIFGTGDRMKAVTMTANVGFVRAAKNQGITFPVFLHDPRALTEQKEDTATKIPGWQNSPAEGLSKDLSKDRAEVKDKDPSEGLGKGLEEGLGESLDIVEEKDQSQNLVRDTPKGPSLSDGAYSDRGSPSQS